MYPPGGPASPAPQPDPQWGGYTSCDPGGTKKIPGGGKYPTGGAG